MFNAWLNIVEGYTSLSRHFIKGWIREFSNTPRTLRVSDQGRESRGKVIREAIHPERSFMGESVVKKPKDFFGEDFESW